MPGDDEYSWHMDRVPWSPSCTFQTWIIDFSSLNQKVLLFSWKSNVAMVSQHFKARPEFMWLFLKMRKGFAPFYQEPHQQRPHTVFSSTGSAGAYTQVQAILQHIWEPGQNNAWAECWKELEAAESPVHLNYVWELIQRNLGWSVDS